MKLKKAAMFGLDARIALAIFGALSVISGAALYSAIQESKVVQLRTILVEIEKAIEAYYLDNGEFLPYVESTHIETIDISYLVDGSGKSLWRGPYISVKKYARTSGSTKGYIVLEQYPSVKWYLTFMNPSTKSLCNSSLINCKIYLRAAPLSTSNTIFEPSLIKSYHDRYDSDGDYNRGDVMFINYVNSSGINYALPSQSIQIRP